MTAPVTGFRDKVMASLSAEAWTFAGDIAVKVNAAEYAVYASLHGLLRAGRIRSARRKDGRRVWRLPSAS